MAKMTDLYEQFTETEALKLWDIATELIETLKGKVDANDAGRVMVIALGRLHAGQEGFTNFAHAYSQFVKHYLPFFGFGFDGERGKDEHADTIQVTSELGKRFIAGCIAAGMRETKCEQCGCYLLTRGDDNRCPPCREKSAHA